jgi:hypothetical protein
VRGLAAAREIGISLFCNFIVSPAYGHEEFDHLIQFIKDNKVDYPSFTILTPIPGTGQDYQNVLDRQANGRPNWDYFDLQHAVTQTKMPKKEFMDRFEDLYQVFSGNYMQCESPLTMESMQEVNEKAEILRSAYIKIAMAALGGGSRPSAS